MPNRFKIQDAQQLITPWVKLTPSFVPLGMQNEFPNGGQKRNERNAAQMSDRHEQDLFPGRPFQLCTLSL